MNKQAITPDWLFEVSWEVCNKVGGIHTVISSKAATTTKLLNDRYILLGPDFPDRMDRSDFEEDPDLFGSWTRWMTDQGYTIRVGRWKIPGNPIAILIDFSNELQGGNQLLGELWYKYGINSLGSGFDYLEPVVFAHQCGRVIDQFCTYFTAEGDKIVAHFHEWMTGAGLLYLKQKLPNIATVFTTHATVLGRSLAGNGFPLYQKLQTINPDEWAEKLNVKAKFDLERASAHQADSFTTVSEITAKECAAFFEKEPDVITPNAFEGRLIATKDGGAVQRLKARKKLFEVARNVAGFDLQEDALLILKSGRYEFQNKGVDVVLESMKKLQGDKPGRQVVLFVAMPAGHGAPIPLERRGENEMQVSHLTHWLVHPEGDPILKSIHRLGLHNNGGEPVTVIFAPVYLNGNDGVIDMTYFELLPGFDMAIFPSYYEPWGYTPMEAIAAGVPALTTILAGFGKWICQNERDHVERGVFIIDRKDDNFDFVVRETAIRIKTISNETKEQYDARVSSALKLAKVFTWGRFIQYYVQAWDKGLEEVRKRRYVFTKGERLLYQKIQLKEQSDHSTPEWRKVFVQPEIPERIAGLKELSFNLWAYWNRDARDLFRTLDEKLWNETQQNPVAILESVSFNRLTELATNTTFLDYYDDVLGRLHSYMKERTNPKGPKIAYFCMEYGLDPLIKLYSGGLGVLAGDYVKEASDSKVDMVAVGLLYRNGYFKQTLNEKGEQIAFYIPQKFTTLPIEPMRNSDGEWASIDIALPDRQIHAKIWKIQVGSVPLYLLDTDVAENTPEDRAITSELYGGDWDNRLKQEILLGIGGVRLLRELNIETELFHLNEGHAAFAGIERLSEMIASGCSFQASMEVVRSSSLFTTHTPVPAGHDAFSESDMLHYFGDFAENLGLSWKSFMSLGTAPNGDQNRFSMSFLASRLSQEVNGVSKIHGDVSKEIFKVLYPGYFKEEVPVGYVTNGAHYPTHTSIEMNLRMRRNFNSEFFHHELNPEKWKFKGVTNQQLWSIRKRLKNRLIEFLNDYLTQNLTQSHQSPKYVMSVLKNLQPETLIIGFARRFATYKRATLLFHDMDRLRNILNNKKKPVIFLFSGKAHPKDIPGQDLIKRVVEISRMPEFLGKIIFLEDYNMRIAKYLVSGCDVWLNNPTRPLEASGTSGIKACFNGVLNLSVLDGWWDEAYMRGTGWALPKYRTYEFQDFQNELDAQMIYEILEDSLIPEFFDRDAANIPQAWLKRIRGTIRQIVPKFTMHRMIDDYFNQYYYPLAERNKLMTANDCEKARELAEWKTHMESGWYQIQVVEIKVFDSSQFSLRSDDEFAVSIELDINGLNPSEVGVELVFTRFDDEQKEQWISRVQELEDIEQKETTMVYSGSISIDTAGVYDYGFRIYPKHELLKYRQDLPLVRWI